MTQSRSPVAVYVLLLWLSLSLPFTAAATTDGLRTADYFISHVSNDPFYQQPGQDPNVVLHVREVVLAGRERTAGPDNKVLLFVHGATFPGTVAFDSDFANTSMMRHFAGLGWDTFTLDMQGYGLSTRPAVMEHPQAFPASQAPMRAEVTVADVARVVDFIRDLRNVKKIHLLGWSLGASLEAPLYAAEHPDKVAKLILYGAEYRWEASDEQRQQKAAERNAEKVRHTPIVSVQDNWARLGTEPKSVIPGAFAAYRRAHLASDPKSGELGGAVRWPLGRFVDLWLFSPHFDAAKLTMPTLVIRGTADTFATEADNQALMDALGSSEKRYVEIPDSGHFLQFETSNTSFYKEIQSFLEGSDSTE